MYMQDTSSFYHYRAH
uniref:Uncharacterized protein n=1 Tax=Arundo donax TaxID=35708 RepID=A0A0A9GB90_ARUDO